MDRYTHLLDTNIVSDLVRHPQRKEAQCLIWLIPYRVCTSLIVVSELRYGVGQPIGYNDFLIAAHALSLNAILSYG